MTLVQFLSSQSVQKTLTDTMAQGRFQLVGPEFDCRQDNSKSARTATTIAQKIYPLSLGFWDSKLIALGNITQKPPIDLSLQNFSKFFYEIRRFIAVIARALHWYVPSQTVSPRPILILSSHLLLCLPSGITPSCVEVTPGAAVNVVILVIRLIYRGCPFWLVPVTVTKSPRNFPR
jgi:hypothetical protein